MDHRVMVSTQQAEVLDLGVATMEPMDHMMSVAITGPGLAPGDHTTPVPSVEGGSDPWGDHPGGPPHIQRHPLRVDHQAGERRVAGDPTQRLGTDQPTILEMGSPTETLQRRQRSDHGDLGTETP